MSNWPPYTQPFDPYSAQSVWSGQGFGSRPSSESSSFKDEMRSFTTSIHKIQATVNDKFLEFDVDSVVSTEIDAFIPKEPSSGNSDCLRSLVYSIRRDMSDMPMSSPSRVSSTSDFMACSGIVKPEVGALYNCFVFCKLYTSKTGGSKFSGFGPASYPGRCRSKDFEIHGSSLGMSAPNCDRAFSSLLGSKPLDGLRLSQASYVKSENNLRCLTFVLETAEHFLSTAGSLLKDKGEEFSDLRSMLLQVDKSLGMSQFLLLGTVANFTLARDRRFLINRLSLKRFSRDLSVLLCLRTSCSLFP
ncbi:Hypothetical predicted protein [Mytilus galloprovincialis]|uniref:Uncharacterized protein n=1 Tax=Mytilus galloprovincialis TaxID=29158 RepID=A0A8B6GZ18_MYTGA|nr:Hypothetical predicted protein [Mytilus galloprovincialis]